MRPIGLPLVLLCALGACTSAPNRPRVSVAIDPPGAAEGWRATAAPADAAAIEAIGAAWASAIGGARPRSAIAAEGPLLDPHAALDHPALPPGSYNCRAIRIERDRARSFPAQFCFIGGEPDGRLSFSKQTGSDLPNGWLYPDGERRYVVLGAQQRRAGDNSLPYGADRRRDLVGVVERVGPFRWRLVMPRDDPPALWVYELTPVPAERQPG